MFTIAIAHLASAVDILDGAATSTPFSPDKLQAEALDADGNLWTVGTYRGA